jgi:hypothetical protein
MRVPRKDIPQEQAAATRDADTLGRIDRAAVSVVEDVYAGRESETLRIQAQVEAESLTDSTWT